MKGSFITNLSAKNQAERYSQSMAAKYFTNVYNRKTFFLYPEDGLPTFKKNIHLKAAVKSARLLVSGLGVFDVHLNGKRVGYQMDGEYVCDEMKPGWTDYRFRVFELDYDVTTLLGKENLIVAQVALGWWSGKISYGAYGYQPVAFACDLKVKYEDGTEETFSTDTSWETSVCGPVVFGEIYDGEYVDARLPKPWVSPESYAWKPADLFSGFQGRVEPYEGPHVCVRRNLNRKPVSSVLYRGVDENRTMFGAIHVIGEKNGDGCDKVTVPKGASVIFDMGQNMVGRPHFVLRAKKGTKITGFCAEMLNDTGMPERGNDGPKGSTYTANYRRALARVVYIAGEEEIQDYHPVFSFYGFRYYEMTSDGEFEILSFTGEVIGSDMKETSDIVTDNAEVNKLVSNIRWGARGNYLSVPTDCPQRDERLGWTGDTQVFCRAGSYLMDNHAFLRKWLRDMRDSQYDPGDDNNNTAYCCVVPRVFMNGAGNQAAWGDAGIIVPWKLYEMYGDKTLLAEHYESMEKYFGGLSRYGLRGPRPTYGDWLNYAQTPKEYVSVCYYFLDASLLGKISSVLGKKDRTAFYEEMKTKIRGYWMENYVDGDKIKVDTQTAYLLPLAFDMAGEMTESFKKELRRLITENDYTLSTGFLGTGVLCQTLSRFGMDDLAYDLLLQTRDPSWLYSVRQGATTIWERWNSYTLKDGFGDVGMNSFNHYSYGAVYEWMMGSMAGILPDTEKPGFEHFILSPRPDFRKETNLPEGQKRIGRMEAHFDSPKGRIESSWTVENGLEWKIAIPSGTTATVAFPLEEGKHGFFLNGARADASSLSGKESDGKLIFELGAGKYTLNW